LDFKFHPAAVATKADTNKEMLNGAAPKKAISPVKISGILFSVRFQIKVSIFLETH
jgi:hypothetical protein